MCNFKTLPRILNLIHAPARFPHKTQESRSLSLPFYYSPTKTSAFVCVIPPCPSPRGSCSRGSAAPARPSSSPSITAAAALLPPPPPPPRRLLLLKASVGPHKRSHLDSHHRYAPPASPCGRGSRRQALALSPPPPESTLAAEAGGWQRRRRRGRRSRTRRPCRALEEAVEEEGSPDMPGGNGGGGGGRGSSGIGGGGGGGEARLRAEEEVEEVEAELIPVWRRWWRPGSCRLRGRWWAVVLLRAAQVALGSAQLAAVLGLRLHRPYHAVPSSPHPPTPPPPPPSSSSSPWVHIEISPALSASYAPPVSPVGADRGEQSVLVSLSPPPPATASSTASGWRRRWR